MRNLWKIVAVFLVAAWLPASSHCVLESAGFLLVDSCCVEKTASEAPHDADHSECQSCQFESGGVLLVKQQLDVSKIQTVDPADCLLAHILPEIRDANTLSSPGGNDESVPAFSILFLLSASPIRGPSSFV